MGSGSSHIANGPAEESTDGTVQGDSIARYLSLPQEIRQMIYGESFKVPDSTYKWLHTPLPGILLVSREIRQEALEVFYKHSRFIIDLDDEVVFGWGPRSALAKRPLGPMASHLARMKKLQLQVAFLEFPGFPDYKHVAFNIDLMNNSEFKFDAFAQEEDLEETLSVNYSLHKRYDGWDLQNTLRGAIKEFLDSDGYGGLTIGEIRHLKNLIDLWEGPGWGTHFPPVGEHRHMYKV